MQALIRDILSFSRIGKETTFVKVVCDEVLDRVLFNLATALQESNIEIILEPLPVLSGDSVLITQIFQNLISNAVKFRRPGIQSSITITAHLQDKWWTISVRDNGIGIPADCTDRIFQLFQRLQLRTDYAGTGIGLAICRKAVRHHGGDITVDSEEGKGSTFHFSLPALDASLQLSVTTA
jgi:signal transduction histidine kinase